MKNKLWEGDYGGFYLEETAKLKSSTLHLPELLALERNQDLPIHWPLSRVINDITPDIMQFAVVPYNMFVIISLPNSFAGDLRMQLICLAVMDLICPIMAPMDPGAGPAAFSSVRATRRVARTTGAAGLRIIIMPCK